MPFANVRSPMGNNPTAPQVNPNRNMVNSGPFGNDFGQFNSTDFMNNSTAPNSQFELAAKQEMMFSQQQTHHMPSQMQSKMNPNAFSKQQFPYGSPNTIGNSQMAFLWSLCSFCCFVCLQHNFIICFPIFLCEFLAPNFMGRNPAQSQHTANSLPPRPPPNAGKPNVNNGAGNCNPMPNNQSTTTLQMKQTQQLHINQHGPNSPGIHVNIPNYVSIHKLASSKHLTRNPSDEFLFSLLSQVSAGQHLHLSGDLKNNVSVAAQQGIFFNQQHTNKAQPPQNMNAGPGCNTNPSNMNNNQQPHVPQPNNNPQSKKHRV